MVSAVAMVEATKKHSKLFLQLSVILSGRGGGGSVVESSAASAVLEAISIEMEAIFERLSI